MKVYINGSSWCLPWNSGCGTVDCLGELVYVRYSDPPFNIVSGAGLAVLDDLTEGLSRHLEWENHKPQGSAPVRAADRTQVIDELIKLAEAPEPPTGRRRPLLPLPRTS